MSGPNVSAGRLARWLPLLIFVIALVPRLWAPSPFVTWDEPTWTYRSLSFLRALGSGQPAGTYLTAHPGVVTMWAGASGVLARAAFADDVSADLAWVDALPEFDEDDTELLAQLIPWWSAARAAIAVLTAALIAAAYALTKRLVGLRTALVAGALLALDPYLLAHSRVLHLDAVLSLLLLLSVLALILGLREDRARFTLLAGALAGAAVLEKSPAMIIAPFTVGAIVAFAVHAHGWREAAAVRSARALVAWGVAAMVAYVLLWPAMWAEPAGTLGGMWAYAAQSAGRSREAVFFWGGIQPDPGLPLYLTAIPFRLTPLALVGVLAALPALFRSDPRRRQVVVTLLAFAAVYAVFMGSGAKKFERYILPVVPALDVVAAVGLVWLSDAVARSRLAEWFRTERFSREPSGASNEATPPHRVANVALAALIALQAVMVLAGTPYHLATYNPLLGGGSAAAKALPVGWGEGMDRAADYLNAKPGAADLTVATPSITLLAPFFDGRTIGARDWAGADYVVLYVDDVQIRRPDVVEALHGVREPEHVVRLSGIEYAWIYDARTGAP